MTSSRGVNLLRPGQWRIYMRTVSSSFQVMNVAWSASRFGAEQATCHYLNQCLLIVNLTLRNKQQWYLNKTRCNELGLKLSLVNFQSVCPGANENQYGTIFHKTRDTNPFPISSLHGHRWQWSRRHLILSILFNGNTRILIKYLMNYHALDG